MSAANRHSIYTPTATGAAQEELPCSFVRRGEMPSVCTRRSRRKSPRKPNSSTSPNWSTTASANSSRASANVELYVAEPNSKHSASQRSSSCWNSPVKTRAIFGPEPSYLTTKKLSLMQSLPGKNTFRALDDEALSRVQIFHPKSPCLHYKGNQLSRYFWSNMTLKCLDKCAISISIVDSAIANVKDTRTFVYNAFTCQAPLCAPHSLRHRRTGREAHWP